MTPLVRTQKASTSKPGLDHTPRKEGRDGRDQPFLFEEGCDHSPRGLVASQNSPRSGTCDLMERAWALVLRRGRLTLTTEGKGGFERIGKISS